MKATIADLRRQLNLNQVQFAELFGVHPMTVSKWERGVIDPNSYQQVLIEEFRKAAGSQKVQRDLKAVLIGAGIAAALFLLLKASQD